MGENNQDIIGDSDSIRILIAGLHKAGKTSISYSLKGDNSLNSLLTLKPTLGHSESTITEASKKISILELGGQETFIASNLARFEQFSRIFKKIIYVIDIRKPELYSESIKYLSQLLSLLPENVSPELLIFLHKFDPNIEKEKDANGKFEDTVIFENLITPLKAVIPKFLNPQIFKTSIVTLFRKSKID